MMLYTGINEHKETQAYDENDERVCFGCGCSYINIGGGLLCEKCRHEAFIDMEMDYETF